MRKLERQRVPLAFKNANTAWVSTELEKLYEEWVAWLAFVQTIEDHPYDKNTHSEVFADGVENLNRHQVLAMKTLTFLDNNVQGHDFMRVQSEGKPFERTDLRLAKRVPHRIQELEVLRASLQYALVPDGFWKEKGKLLVDTLARVGPEKAAELATKLLRNPTAPV